MIVDDNNFKFFGSAQDHKRMKKIGDQIQGAGAYSPAPIITKNLEKIISRIIKPTLNTLKTKKNPYNGFLYWFNDKE